MKRLIYALAALASTSYAGVVADVTLHGTKISSHGETRLDRRTSTLDVTVMFKTRKVDIGKPSEVEPSNTSKVFPCTYSRYPCSVVESIKINVDGKPLEVPRGAFRDLADEAMRQVRTL
jgi:hypothetical protein